MGDAGIVRNRAKIEAAIANARAAAEVDDLDAPDLVVRARRAARRRARGADVPAVTPESTALAKALKRRGFRFVGPTTAYALMQACGLVDDHLEGCCARWVERLEPGGARPPHEWLAEVRPHERAPADRPFVYLNMVSSVDGRAAIDGRTPRWARPPTRCC